MEIYSDGKVALMEIATDEDDVYMLDKITINGHVYQQWAEGKDLNGDVSSNNVLVFLNTEMYSNKVLLEHLESINIKLV